MDAEGNVEFLEDVLEAARLDAPAGGLGIAVHRIAAPHRAVPGPAHRLDHARQMLLDVLDAEAVNQRQATRLVLRIEDRHQLLQPFIAHRRADLDADRIGDAAEILHVRALDRGRAHADPGHVCGQVVPAILARYVARLGLLVQQVQALMAGKELDPQRIANLLALHRLQQHQTHLQQDLQLLGNVVGLAVRKTLGAIAPLEQEGLAALRAGETRAQIVDLPGHHDRREARQIGDHALQRRAVLVYRLLLRLAGLPARRLPGSGIGRSPPPDFSTADSRGRPGSLTSMRAPFSAAESAISTSPPYSATVSATNARPRPWPGARSSALTPRARTRPRSSGAIPGPSSSTRISSCGCTARSSRSCTSARTLPVHHLQALSSRLPSSSIMSPRSPTKPARAATSVSIARSLLECTLSIVSRSSVSSVATGSG